MSILDDPPPLLTNVVLYPFNEGSGVTANDLSGNYPATLVGATWVLPGKFGAAALAFNGISSKVTTSLSTHTPQRTYLLWSNRTGTGNSIYPRLFDKRTSGGEVKAFYYDSPAGVYRYLRIWSGGTGSWTIPAPTANTWHHIAVVYDASTAINNPQIYVDGVARPVTRASAPSGTPLTNPDPYVLGNRGTGDRNWSGQLDEVHIYNRLLTGSEVQTDMTTPIGFPPPTVTGVTPSSGNQGQTLTGVVITGSNFQSGAVCSFGSRVTVNSCTVSSSTQLTASLTIASNAPTGVRTVSVTNPDGQSGSLANAFSVKKN